MSASGAFHVGSGESSCDEDEARQILLPDDPESECKESKHFDDPEMTIWTRIGQRWSAESLRLLESWKSLDLWKKLEVRIDLDYEQDERLGGPLLAWTVRQATYIWPFLRAFLIFCIPSFLKPTEPRPLKSLAALDGLRGYASLGVVTLHLTDTFCQNHNKGWGWDSTEQFPFQLPFVHFFWSAPSLVACFFVLSGYVLSYKALKLVQAGQIDELLSSMKSAIFRRGIRLYVPMITATFMWFLLLWIGFFDYSHQVFVEGWTSATEDTPPMLGSFWEQFRDWLSTQWNAVYPLEGGGGSSFYDPHLFTIPTEFRASMLLFLYIIGTASLRPVYRRALTGMIVVWLAHRNSNEFLLFFAGMFLCDIDLWLRQRRPATEMGSADSPTDRPLEQGRIFWLACFMVGLYCAGMPSWDPQITPGYRTMMKIMPNWFRWNSIGNALILWAVRNSAPLQCIFTNAFAHYLGNISFAVYIVHGNIRRSLTFVLIPFLAHLLQGEDGVPGPPREYARLMASTDPARYAMIVAMDVVLTYAVVICLADIWWRAVDLPSIRLARWIETKTCVKA